MTAQPDRRDAPLVRDPVYQQLNDRLRALIRGGEFAAGQQFLTERQVAARFGVSRPTANKALASLVTEGLLEFRKGVGTFVRGGVLDYDLRRLTSFTDQVREMGMTPGTRVVAFRDVPAAELEPPALAALQLPADAAVVYLERLRLADDSPVAFERRWVDARLCPGLSAGDAAGSIYGAWRSKYRLDLLGANKTIRAVGLNRRQAELLGVLKGAAALLVTATGFVAGGRPLWWEETLYRGDAYEFSSCCVGPAVAPLVDRVVRPG